MSEEDDKQCFRCGVHPKVLISPVVDGKPVHLCIDCYRDFIMMLEGYAVSSLAKCKREDDADE